MELSDLERLLPCPFCGSNEISTNRINDEHEFVMCGSCGAMADSSDTLPERTPLEVWNMRANAGNKGPA
jgi:Lar family restriction alleviation protein